MQKCRSFNKKAVKPILIIVLFLAGIGAASEKEASTAEANNTSRKQKKERQFSVSEQEDILIAHIEKSKEDKSLQNIILLGNAGQYYGNGNYSVQNPHDGYIEQIRTASSDTTFFVFNPKIDFEKAKPYLKPTKKGSITNYTILYSLINDSIASQQTIISYGKEKADIVANDNVFDIADYINSKKVKLQKTEYEKQIALEKAERELKKNKENFEKNCFRSYDGSHIKLVEFVKNSMHDPSSFEHVGTRYILENDYGIVIMTFRGKNAFGAVVKNRVKAKVSLSNCMVLKIYDK